jgi:hypothetical protein
MGTLSLYFHGACTHFRGVVPGVPHRVVLVDAMNIRFGEFAVRNQKSISKSTLYTLMPHVAQVSDVRAEHDLTVPGVMDEGFLDTGAHFRVVNAVGALEYPNDYATIPPMTAFVDHYHYSTEVVLGGRAACYFDLFSGVLSIAKGHLAVDIRTEGSPILRVTPFDNNLAARDIVLGDEAVLSISNRDVVGAALGAEGSEEDFLLHFLTDVRGIPRVLTQRPAEGTGMRRVEDATNDGLKELGDASWQRMTPEDRRKLRRAVTANLSRRDVVNHLGTQASCSDSRYP